MKIDYWDSVVGCLSTDSLRTLSVDNDHLVEGTICQISCNLSVNFTKRS